MIRKKTAAGTTQNDKTYVHDVKTHTHIYIWKQHKTTQDKTELLHEMQEL